MVTAPSAAFDGVAALQCLAAVWLAAAGRWKAALVILAVAVFTKESSLPVVAAFGLYGTIARRNGVAAAAAATIALWLSARTMAFGSAVGIYVFAPSSGGWRDLAVPASVALWLPVAAGNSIPFRELLTGRVGDWGALAIVIANVLIAGCTCFAASRLETRERPGAGLDRAALLRLSMVCVVACGVYFLIIRGGARFSYPFYVMFLAMIAAVPRTKWRLAALGLLSGAALLSTSLAMSSETDARPAYFLRRAAAKKMIASLRAINLDKHVVIANDFVSGYS